VLLSPTVAEPDDRDTCPLWPGAAESDEEIDTLPLVFSALLPL
jgi:hypothetical protein